MVLAKILFLCSILLPKQGYGRPGLKSLYNLDQGFQFSFAQIKTGNGENYEGQIIGIYNDNKFMWHPTEFTTLTLFSCSDSLIPLNGFSVVPGENPAIFSVSSRDIISIEVIVQPDTLVEYREYMRSHQYALASVPVEGEVWISEAWTTYHVWEDGRSNYAWDMGALNSQMMSYSRFGAKNTDFEVFGKSILLPMAGKILTAVEKEIDNEPDLTAAVDLEDKESGSEVDLTEKPQNMVEVEIGGNGSPCMLRLLHLKQDSIPNDIQVGSVHPVGTLVGLVGNSGTTYVPHLHTVFGYTDNNDRFWALPIEWANVEHRKILPYPHGYEYGPYHQHQFYYPKLGDVVKNV